jgi:hypothetical protein
MSTERTRRTRIEPKPLTPDLFASGTQRGGGTAAAQGGDGLDGLTAAHAAHAAQRSRLSASSWQAWLIGLLALLALNGALWVAYTSEKEVLGSNSDARALADLASEKISFLPNGSALALQVATPAGFTASKPPASGAAASSAATGTACLLWEFTANADVKRADSRLAEQAWSGYTTELAAEAPTYLVFVGPYSTQTQLDAKLKVLKKLKLEDYNTLPDDSISLGVLYSPEAAKALQSKLTKRGLTDVEVLERSSGKRRNRLRFETISADKAAELKALAQDLGKLRACAP